MHSIGTIKYSLKPGQWHFCIALVQMDKSLCRRPLCFFTRLCWIQNRQVKRNCHPGGYLSNCANLVQYICIHIQHKPIETGYFCQFLMLRFCVLSWNLWKFLLIQYVIPPTGYSYNYAHLVRFVIINNFLHFMLIINTTPTPTLSVPKILPQCNARLVTRNQFIDVRDNNQRVSWTLSLLFRES